ncbi:MAG: DUF899 domain-containing protein [Deltaproteobacteria bacterium]
MTTPKRTVDTREAWIEARKELLAREKEFSRLREQLAQQRRELPWERVEKDYVFDTADGPKTLAELFDGRSQLIVYHFMFDSTWTEGCKLCSFWADNFERNVVHLKHRDVTLVSISRGPIDRLMAYRERMGWTFTWASSGRNDFNHDYGVTITPEEIGRGEATYNYAKAERAGEMHGISVFARDDDGSIYHTYSCYSRGLDNTNTAYQYLDLVPKGRDEAGLSFSMAWVRRRDDYDR